ncbi:Pvc16 family protein [Streptomyces sp. NPDC052107]|uniref:Pvc16 family protein n=1 Tax=Streptomyces sp. NPDC052107 TaxID=3155632 RepID=UPI00343D419C
MTAHFAIPATTFVLQDIIQRRIKAAYGHLTAPTVSVEPPPRPPATPAGTVPTPQPEPAGLYLFLHHVALNAAWRNMHEVRLEPEEPGKTEGPQVGPSPLAVDLHYMLAATGADLEREVLLGLGIAALNRRGIVPRSLIRSILSGIEVPRSPTRLLDYLTAEPLHDPDSQPQRITVSQMPVDVDLSTKIWSSLQSPMRPCAHFLVTTVFLDLGDSPSPIKEVTRAQVGVRPDPQRSNSLPPGDTVTITGGA